MAPPTTCNKQASELPRPAAVTPSSKATGLHFSPVFTLARDNYLKINQECVDSQGVKSGQGLLMAKVPGSWN